MRYDLEIPVAKLFADYLNAQCNISPGGVLDTTLCSIVTFYDPMSIDEADRVIVTVPDAETYPEQGGNFDATVEIYQKTLWTQKTIQAAMTLHFLRVNEVRDKLFAPDIIARMVGIEPAGLVVNFVNPRMRFSTKTIGDDGGWIASETTLAVKGYQTA
jgi:hypothetical protein